MSGKSLLMGVLAGAFAGSIWTGSLNLFGIDDAADDAKAWPLAVGAIALVIVLYALNLVSQRGLMGAVGAAVATSLVLQMPGAGVSTSEDKTYWAVVLAIGVVLVVAM